MTGFSIRIHFTCTSFFFLLPALQIQERMAMEHPHSQLNVFGQRLEICSESPVTGWFRDGYARTDEHDRGVHSVCATMTTQFLNFTKNMGNDLSTPRGPSFPGLKPGDRWALCALRWKEAQVAGYAPLVKLDATNIKTLDFVNLETLQRYDDTRVAPMNSFHSHEP